jgi:hypothetical protein
MTFIEPPAPLTMTIFALNRLKISLKRFVEIEMPKCQLVYYGNDKYYGNCQLPNHREAVDGQSFLIDEQSGRATCIRNLLFGKWP